MRQLRYVVADVFTDTPLEGNQLAVFTDARDLDDATMQALAKEMAFSETVFVPAPAGRRRRRPDPHLHAGRRAAVRRAPDPRLGIRARRPAAEDRHPPRDRRRRRPGRARARGRRRSPSAGWTSRSRRGSRSTTRPSSSPCSGSTARASRSSRMTSVPASSTSSWARPRPSPRSSPTSGRSWGSSRTGRTASPVTASAGSRGCSLPQTASPRIRRPAPRQARSRCISPATAGSAFGEEIEIRQGVELGRPSTLYAEVEGTPERIERVRVGGSAVVVARGEFRIP